MLASKTATSAAAAKGRRRWRCQQRPNPDGDIASGGARAGRCHRRPPRFIKRAQELGFTLDEIEELLHLNTGGPASCDAARALAEHRRADLERRIRDLQRMHDSLADLVATCGLPLADRSCALLDAIDHRPKATR